MVAPESERDSCFHCRQALFGPTTKTFTHITSTAIAAPSAMELPEYVASVSSALRTTSRVGDNQRRVTRPPCGRRTASENVASEVLASFACPAPARSLALVSK